MKNSIKSVLFITTSFPRFVGDFAGSFVFRFAKYLVRGGIEVTVIAPGAFNYPSIDLINGVTIYRFTYFYPRKLQNLAYTTGGILANLRHSRLSILQLPFFFMSLIITIFRHQNQYDLIHCHWSPTALAALLVGRYRKKKIPIIFTNWGSDTRLLPKRLTKWIVDRVDGCISTAAETDQHLLDAGRNDFCRIMAPIDEEKFDIRNVSSDLRQDLCINEHIPILSFVGRLNYFKDPLTFIQACAYLKKNDISFAAIIAGDGDLMPACRFEIKRNELQSTVFLLGMRSDPERIYRIASIMIHISPVENTWANSIAEAMFMGVPVILSDAGYTKRLFTHHKDCVMVPPRNPIALAEAINNLINNNALRNQLIQGAKDLLKKYKKDSHSITKETLKYYQEIIFRRSQ